MSEDNVEIVRRIFENFPAVQDRLRSGDLPIGEPFAEDVEWDASDLNLPDLGDGHLRGREAVRRFWATWLSAWGNVGFEYELRGAGGHVVALIDQWMSGTEIDLPFGSYAQLWTFKDGEVIRWTFYREQDEALKAAGL